MNISEQYEMKKEYDKQKAALKNDAGCLGAAALVINNKN